MKKNFDNTSEFSPILAKPTRLDIVLANHLSQSRASVQNLIREGMVLVNGDMPKKTGDLIRLGDKISVLSRKQPEEDQVAPKIYHVLKSNVVVLGDTDNYLVIHKPTGLLVHEAPAHDEGTLADWLLEKYPMIRGVGEEEIRPGIVHRLDKEASGLMVVAKTQPMFENLKKQFQSRTIDKEYLVLVHGIMSVPHAIIDFDIDRGSNGRMVSRPKVDNLSLKSVNNKQHGKTAITEYTLVHQYARFALLRVKIHTGRTHQIRVHMLAINHPVVGDNIYFNIKLNRKRDFELGRLFLHATKLCFDDLGGNRVCFEDPLPEDLEKFLENLKTNSLS